MTPWNRGGYAATLRHACKLNFVSPTWFTLTFQHGKFIVTGDHDVDREWLHAMRSQNDPASTTSNPSSGCVSRTKIVPRVLSQLTGPALSTLLSSKEAQLQCIIALLDYVTRLGLDGLTLEMTEAWQAVGNNTPARKALNTFIKRLGKLPIVPLNLDDCVYTTNESDVTPIAPLPHLFCEASFHYYHVTFPCL